MQEYTLIESFPTAGALRKAHLENLMDRLARARSETVYGKTLKRVLHILNSKRNAGHPDRFREEEVLRIMEQKEAKTANFWEKGGYQWQA